MAMDLGTANTLIYIRKRGIVYNEPSLIALNVEDQKVVAVGNAAKKMYGRTGRSIQVVRPLRQGSVNDFDATSAMIKTMLATIQRGFAMRGSRLVIGVPAGITFAERRAVADAADRSGVSSVFLVDECMAAAIGSGISLSQNEASMIVDIGGGTTEIGIINAGGTLSSHSIRVAGDDMDEAIQRHLKEAYSLNVGIFEAERIKLLLGSIDTEYGDRSAVVVGQDLKSGLPAQRLISERELSYCLVEPTQHILEAVFNVLESSSPEIVEDICERGICVTGGGSLLPGLPEILSRELGVACYRAQDPLGSVVRGVGKVVDDLKAHRSICLAVSES
jgi:rod shape-determining protein MreB